MNVGLVGHSSFAGRLREELVTLLTGDSGTAQAEWPSELHTILALAAALDEGHYAVLDSEQLGLEICEYEAHFSNRLTAARWEGGELNSLGYGSVDLVSTDHGDGLAIYVAGTPMNGASTILVLREIGGMVYGGLDD